MLQPLLSAARSGCVWSSTVWSHSSSHCLLIRHVSWLWHTSIAVSCVCAAQSPRWLAGSLPLALPPPPSPAPYPQHAASIQSTGCSSGSYRCLPSLCYLLKAILRRVDVTWPWWKLLHTLQNLHTEYGKENLLEPSAVVSFSYCRSLKKHQSVELIVAPPIKYPFRPTLSNTSRDGTSKNNCLHTSLGSS